MQRQNPEDRDTKVVSSSG